MVRRVIDLGEQPLGGDYPEPADTRPEPRWPLVGGVCTECHLLQLMGDVPVEPQVPGTAPGVASTTLRAHVRGFADDIARRAEGRNGPILEMASHGGYLHDALAAAGVQSLVAESSPALVDWLETAGTPVERSLTAALRRAAGPGADEPPGAAVIADNYLLAHLPDPAAMAGELRAVLAPDGVLVMEFDHVLGIVAGGQWDALRHGHFTYWSLHALHRLLDRHGLAIVDVSRQPVYGGALRAVVRQRESAGRPADSVAALLTVEHEAGLDGERAWTTFSEAVATSIEELRDFLVTEREAGRRVAGYGAPSRGATLLNAARIGPDLLAFTVDRSTAKQGRLMPGSRVPISAPDRLRTEEVDVVLILTWDISAEIVGQLGDLRSRGTRFAVPIPNLTFLGG